MSNMRLPSDTRLFLFFAAVRSRIFREFSSRPAVVATKVISNDNPDECR